MARSVPRSFYSPNKWSSDEGIPLLVVALLLGYAQVQMTMRYAHVRERDAEAASERIGGVMSGIMNRSLVRSKATL